MRVAFWLLMAGCGAPQKPAVEAAPKLPPPKSGAAEELEDGARLARLGPGSYERALARLRAAEELDDKLWEAYYDEGWIELERHRPEAAARALAKAVALQPTRAAPVELLGEAYLALSRVSDATKVWRVFLDKAPPGEESNRVRVRLGSALRLGGKLDEAIESFRQVLRVQPRSMEALNGLALVYQTRGQPELAQLVLRRAKDIDSKSKTAAALWNNLGLVALALRHDQEAFADFDQAARLDPGLTVARRNKAIVYLDCGDYRRAAEELRLLVRSDPSDVEAWVALGVAERGRGALEAAGSAYAKALAIDPQSPDALYDLAVLHMDFKKDRERARDELERFVKVAPPEHRKRSDAEARLKELAPKPPARAQSVEGGKK